MSLATMKISISDLSTLRPQACNPACMTLGKVGLQVRRQLNTTQYTSVRTRNSHNGRIVAMKIVKLTRHKNFDTVIQRRDSPVEIEIEGLVGQDFGNVECQPITTLAYHAHGCHLQHSWQSFTALTAVIYHAHGNHLPHSRLSFATLRCHLPTLTAVNHTHSRLSPTPTRGTNHKFPSFLLH
jgi:hypothetical protein